MISWPTPPTTFERWAAELRLSRQDIEIQPLNPTEKNWRSYANAVNQSSVCQSVNAPRAEAFADWRSWANGFIKSFGQNS